MTTDLISEIKVSSTLGGDVKQYGKQNMLDGSQETCWQPETGRQMHRIQLKFHKQLQLSCHSLCISFQGGFTARLIDLYGLLPAGPKVHLCSINTRDTNDRQTFNLSQLLSDGESEEYVGVELELKQCTDLFGRLVVYELNFI